jgi:hypothetical protein
MKSCITTDSFSRSSYVSSARYCPASWINVFTSSLSKFLIRKGDIIEKYVQQLKVFDKCDTEDRFQTASYEWSQFTAEEQDSLLQMCLSIFI